MSPINHTQRSSQYAGLKLAGGLSALVLNAVLPVEANDPFVQTLQLSSFRCFGRSGLRSVRPSTRVRGLPGEERYRA